MTDEPRDTLAELRDTPLAEIPADRVAEVVRRVARREHEVAPLEVAQFGSSI